MLDIGWDYFTGSSWQEIRDCVLDVLPVGDIAKRKVMQYDGMGLAGASGWFVGTAIQQDGRGNDMIHNLLVATSDTADLLRLPDTACLPECKRLDLQITALKPGAFDLKNWGLRLKTQSYGAFNRRGRYPHIGLILSDTATVYIGKRGKRRMIRVYEKSDGDGNKFIRFELELGAELANHYKGAARYTTGLAAVLLEEFYCLPTSARYAMQFIGDGLQSFAAGKRQPRIYPEQEKTDTFGWLLMALHSARKHVRGGSFTTEQIGLLAIAANELINDIDAIAL